MNIPCYNSMMADRYADEQGRLAERDIWIENNLICIHDRLDDGGSVCIGHCTYTKAEILMEEMEPYDFNLLAQAHTMGGNGEAHIKELNERISDIMTRWVDKHVEDILAAEAPDDFDDYLDVA